MHGLETLRYLNEHPEKVSHGGNVEASLPRFRQRLQVKGLGIRPTVVRKVRQTKVAPATAA
jgi:hypothetical protein